MIEIKTPQEIEIMAEGGRILAKIMNELKKKVKPGITTMELEKLAESLILKAGGKCSFKGYKSKDGESARPYPFCLCTSVNEEIVHVPPSNRVLKEGDVLKLDLGIFYKGFHTDMAITIPVGKVSFEAQRLIRATKKALKLAIKKKDPEILLVTLEIQSKDILKAKVSTLSGNFAAMELEENCTRSQKF